MIRDRLRTVATELRRLARPRELESELEWPNGLRLTKLSPVKPWHVMNKAGRVVFRGQHAGAPIKLYEAFSVAHAQFIEALGKLEETRAWFPKVIARHGRCLVTEWVQGEAPPDDLAPVEIARIAVALHAIPSSRVPAVGYDFWADFLRPRFVRAGDMVGSSVDDIVALVDAETSLPTSVVVHPDLRPVNLIRARSGWVLIDNEYCSISSLPLLDVCHTAQAFGVRGNEYWRTYRELARLQPSTNTLAALQGAWLARLVGANFVAGRIGEAAATLSDYRAGKNVLPFDPS